VPDVHDTNANASRTANGQYSPPPEADLIRHARERHDPPMSRRQAAAKAGISPSQWSYIERGHKQAGSGIAVPVQATAMTLALMAQTVGISTGELETAGRSDAARQLSSTCRDQDLRRRLATVPGLGSLGDRTELPDNARELLPLIAAGLDDINDSQLPAKAKQELTSMFVDNLLHDATRRGTELAMLLRIATQAAQDA
jgi:hypothetical protein